MHHPIRHTQVGRLASGIATAAAMSVLVFAACANAEATDAIAPSSTAVEESTASVEAVLPTTSAAAEPAEAPERVEAPEVVSASAASEAVASAAASVSSVASVSTPAPPDSPSTSALPLGRAAPEAAAAVDQVTELAGKVSREAATQTTASVTRSAEAVVQSTKAVAQTADPATAIGHVQQLSRGVLEETGEALHRGALDLLTPDAVENLLPAAGALSGVDTGPSSLPAMAKLTSPAPAGSFPHEQATALESLLAQRLAAPGGLGALGLMAQSSADNPAAGVPPRTAADAIGALSGNVAQRPESENVAPRDGNGPIPLRHPPPLGAIASGLAGSSFVPIAALLALLALAAPAILRRLGEVPACRAPVPFACALERPG